MVFDERTCLRWFMAVDRVLIQPQDKIPDMIIKDDNISIKLSPQNIRNACSIARHLKMEVKEINGKLYLEKAADWEAVGYTWSQDNLKKVIQVTDRHVYLDEIPLLLHKLNLIENNKERTLEVIIPQSDMKIRYNQTTCHRWYTLMHKVFYVTLSLESDTLESDDSIQLPNQQAMIDACKIALHLKMGVKVIDGKLHLEEAADWEAEQAKKWTQEDLFQAFQAIDLKDIQAWMNKFEIIANNAQIITLLLDILNGNAHMRKIMR
jgi:hypothetical protein